jgi:hypothetical protein
MAPAFVSAGSAQTAADPADLRVVSERVEDAPPGVGVFGGA